MLILDRTSTVTASRMAQRILVVDDDPGLRELLEGYLRDSGYEVQTVADGEAMREQLARTPSDLIVLDLMLPGEDGLTLCRRLRAHSSVPILMLTARGDEFERVLGLEMGADDYLAKPFSPRELLARIRSILRRAGDRGSSASSRIGFDGWTLDLGAHHLIDPEGVVVALSTGEFRLLRALAENLNRVLTRDQLIDAIAGREANRLERTVDVLVSRLRKHLRDDAREPRMIRTVRSEGYMLVSRPLPLN
jgi:two-component system, OmpR family, response regulator